MVGSVRNNQLHNSKNVCLRDIKRFVAKTSGSSKTLNIFVRGGQQRNFGVLGQLFARIKSLGNVQADKFYKKVFACKVEQI